MTVFTEAVRNYRKSPKASARTVLGNEGNVIRMLIKRLSKCPEKGLISSVSAGLVPYINTPNLDDRNVLFGRIKKVIKDRIITVKRGRINGGILYLIINSRSVLLEVSIMNGESQFSAVELRLDVKIEKPGMEALNEMPLNDRPIKQCAHEILKWKSVL